jgi:hypothetical protein
VEKLIGREVKSKGGMIVDEAHGWVQATREVTHELFFGALKPGEESKKSAENSMTHLTPGERDVVSAIEANIAKLGFRTIVRFIYWAKTDIFSSAHKASVLGAFKQFNSLNLNGFKTNSRMSPSSAGGLFKKRKELYRKISVLNNYKKRYFPFRGFSGRGFVLNTEELATIYHVPGKIVAAPMMPRIEAKKGGPPSSLPVEQ